MGGLKERDRKGGRAESLDFILGAGHECRELSLAMSGWHMGPQLVLMGVPG